MSDPILFGVDYAWGRPSIPSLQKAGVKFACRYLSHDTTGKNATAAEVKKLSDSKIAVALVWETTAKRPLSGFNGGVQDAKAAMAQAKSVGKPDSSPIYFAADWDVSSSQMSTLISYLKGVNSVLGVERTGLYGGYAAVRAAFNAGVIKFGWQTYAWSGGKWDSRAQLQQYSNDHTIGGVGLDYDHGHGNFGQFLLGEPTPTPVPDPSPGTPKWPGRFFMYPPGIAGLDVKQWQTKMHDRGWAITADGDYGSKSKATCIAFQKEKKLTVDGIVGKVTWNATWEMPL